MNGPEIICLSLLIVAIVLVAFAAGLVHLGFTPTVGVGSW